MKWSEQGTVGSRRYAVVPRTLVFVTADDDLLLLRGAPTKRIWPRRLNGIGGHLEEDEDPLTGARREVHEESGLAISALTLRGIIHVSGQAPDPGVILFVFVGRANDRAIKQSAEGSLEWHPLSALPFDEMVADLPHLLPLLFDERKPAPVVYGVYSTDANGEMSYHLTQV